LVLKNALVLKMMTDLVLLEQTPIVVEEPNGHCDGHSTDLKKVVLFAEYRRLVA
jgi:hypothetical protein